MQRDGSCRFGENCSQAHKEDELDEWKKRFEVRRREAQKGREQGADYCDSLLQKWLAADNKQTVVGYQSIWCNNESFLFKPHCDVISTVSPYFNPYSVEEHKFLIHFNTYCMGLGLRRSSDIVK